MAKRAAKPSGAAKPGAAAKPAAGVKRLLPPKNGVTIRMYRIGHGDCFLLAFPGKKPSEPAYVLIDCGYKPGSPKYLSTTPKEVVKNLREATGDAVAVAVITHEHQDHVNAITEGNFGKTAADGLKIKETWLAWTENPEDELANKLRTAYKDKLLGLIEARNSLAAAGDGDKVKHLDNFLAFELGGEDAELGAGILGAAAADPSNSANKKAMKLWKDRASDGVRYLRADSKKILTVPGADDVRVYVLGPPRDENLLADLDPHGEEGFHKALALSSPGNYFAAAAAAQAAGGKASSPFSSRYTLELSSAHDDPDYRGFFTVNYGSTGAPDFFDSTSTEGKTPENADWRRIDKDWLYSAEQLALAMNSDTNNASLVLAFELGRGGKVLLFAADAQRGNWFSWSNGSWNDGGDTITAQELLARTTLYKVGHHGSHNATLHGERSSTYANLEWFGQKGDEFMALIPAVREWAINEAKWDHPLQSIKDAVTAKAKGRVLQTDTSVDALKKPDGVSKADWQLFLDQVDDQGLFFDLTIAK
jgi:beta-lactamase superfamily II metal-dependent hydrolase